MECGGGWSGPRGRRRRRRERRRGPDGVPGELEEERQRQRLLEAREELLSSEFWNSSLRILLRSRKELLACRKEMPLPTVEDALLGLQLCPAALLPDCEQGDRRECLRCVCYGLGNFSSCFKARFQLAFLLLLLEELQIPKELCCIFDPAFSPLEKETLSCLGLSVMLQNEVGGISAQERRSMKPAKEKCWLQEGKRPIAEPTVFYMIHCSKALYNNLLWSNWSAEALSKVVIIGNSFKGIEERVPARIFQVDYAYIAKVLMAAEEEALPPHARYLDVFNDTAVHCFPWQKLQEVPQETWSFQEEPVYQTEDQLEIIRNDNM